MRKKLSLLMALLMVLSIFTACSAPATNSAHPEGSTPVSQEPDANTDAGELVVATVPKQAGILWFDSMDTFGKEWADKNNAQHHYIGPIDFDSAQQLSSLNDAIALKPDVLTVVPIALESVDELLKKARDNGTVVVTHEGHRLTNIDYNVEAFNNKEFGEHFLDLIVDFGGEDAEYAITVGNLTVSSHMEWAEALLAAQLERYPNMKSVSGDQFYESNNSADDAYNQGKQLIQQYPNLKVIWAGSASSAIGYARAVEELDMIGKVAVIGVCPPSETVTGFERGSIVAGSFWNPGLAQQACYEIGLRVIDGRGIKEGDDLGVPGYESITMDGKTVMGAAWIDVDKDNIQEYVDII